MSDGDTEAGINFDGDHIVKILLIGDSGVGKSCLLSRFADDSFTEEFTPTIGVDFRARTVDLDGKLVKIQMVASDATGNLRRFFIQQTSWDTAGQERFRAITKCYYRGAHGVVIVYDVTDLKTFSDVGMWLQQIDAYGQEGLCKLLIGNKCDLATRREVDYDLAKDYADKHGMPLVETSAKNSANVDQAFVQLVLGIKQYLSNNTFVNKPHTGLTPKTEDTKRTKFCC